MIIKDSKGQSHEFPEDATIDEVNEALGFSSGSNQRPEPSFSERHPTISHVLNKLINEDQGLISPQDVGAGAMKGAQNLAALLGEGGNALGTLMTGGRAPAIDIREELGLGKERPVDLGEVLGSNRNSGLSKAIGQYAPGILSGGSSLLGQAVANGLYGMTQAQPNEEESLLQGRLKKGLEEGGLTYAGGKLIPMIPGALGKAYGISKKAVNYLMPGRDTETFVRSLSPGAETAEQNIAQLTNRIQENKSLKKEEALSEKEKFMSNASGNRVLPLQKNPEPIINEAIKASGISPYKVGNEEKSELSKAISNYYKNGDIDTLSERVEDIFDHPGLSEENINNLEGALTLDKPIKTNYQKIKEPDTYGDKKIYNEAMKKAHADYIENPTVRNADILQRRIFRKMKNTKRQINNGTASDDDIEIYNKLNKNRNKVIEDINTHISTLPDNLQSHYSNFRNLWREEVSPYTNPGKGRVAIREMSRGETVKPAGVSSAFSYPNKEVKKIVEHIGEGGKRNVIRNELRSIDPRDAGEIAKAIQRLKLNGFDEYINPEMEKTANSLLRRSRAKKAVQYGVGAPTALLGGGALTKAVYNYFTGGH